MSICYDMRFPYLYRTLSQAGAQILTFLQLSHALPEKPTGIRYCELVTENGCFVECRSSVANIKMAEQPMVTA